MPCRPCVAYTLRPNTAAPPLNSCVRVSSVPAPGCQPRCLCDTSDKGEIYLAAKQVRPHVLEVRQPRLQLLRHRVHVAEAAFERMTGEDCGCSSGMVGKINRVTRAVNGMRRRSTAGDAM